MSKQRIHTNSLQNCDVDRINTLFLMEVEGDNQS